MKMFLHLTVRSNRRWSHAKQTRPAVHVDPAMHMIKNVWLLQTNNIVPASHVSEWYVLYALPLFNTPSSLARSNLRAALHWHSQRPCPNLTLAIYG